MKHVRTQPTPCLNRACTLPAPSYHAFCRIHYSENNKAGYTAELSRAIGQEQYCPNIVPRGYNDATSSVDRRTKSQTDRQTRSHSNIPIDTKTCSLMVLYTLNASKHYGPTDRRTGRPSYRDARTHLKTFTMQNHPVFDNFKISVQSYQNFVTSFSQILLVS